MLFKSLTYEAKSHIHDFERSPPTSHSGNICHAVDLVTLNADVMKTDDNRCRECGEKLQGRNAIDVGYCIPCFHGHMLGGFDEPEEDDFERCSDCDGHDACADFGCAIKAGLGHLLNNPL